MQANFWDRLHAKLGEINSHSHIHPTCSLWIKFLATSLLASRSKNYHKFVPILQGDLTDTSNFLIKILKMGRKFCKYGWFISNGDMVITGDIIHGMWRKPEKANYIFEETTVTFTSYCKIWSHLKIVCSLFNLALNLRTRLYLLFEKVAYIQRRPSLSLGTVKTSIIYPIWSKLVS